MKFPIVVEYADYDSGCVLCIVCGKIHDFPVDECDHDTEAWPLGWPYRTIVGFTAAVESGLIVGSQEIGGHNEKDH